MEREGMTPPSVIPPDAFNRVLADLERIERDERVRILFAVESGSRAWGFPSPDSDYDARFVYAREADWYLSLQPGRDVIDLPIDGDFDINGWDIRKALLLLLKPNPVLLEWLSSPIRYRWDDEACATLRAFAERTAYARACLHHYVSLARRMWNEFVEGRESVNLKKYLYILRPAMCIAWIRERSGAIPPMSLPELMAGIELEAGFREEVMELLARKARTSEVGDGPRLATLEAFIQRQWAWANEQDMRVTPDKAMRAEAEELFRAFVRAG
jgi:predicted nucleotidyltransferase